MVAACCGQFSGEDVRTHDTFAALTGQVRVNAQHARTGSSSEQHIVVAITNVLTDHAEQFPALAQTMAEAAADTDRDHAFDFGLERILDGLQALIEARS